MKQMYLLLLLVSLQGYAQDYARQTSWTEKAGNDNNKEYEVKMKTVDGSSHGYLNNIPSAVLMQFVNEYPDAINVSWLIDDKESTVYCNWENELIISKYKNNGFVLFTRKTYTIDKVDRPFADFIKREIGTKHEVNYITEFVRDDTRHYEISLSNEKEWMTVRLTRDKSTGGLMITEKKLFNK